MVKGGKREWLFVIGSSEDTIPVWIVEAGQVIERLAGYSLPPSVLPLSQVCCLPLCEGEYLLSGSEDGKVKEWSPRPVEEDTAASVCRLTQHPLYPSRG